MNNLATEWEAVERHPKDPDHLPATHAWRELVLSHIVDDKVAKEAAARGEELWTRSKLAKAAKTTPGHILKLLNGTTKSSPVVRRINKVLGISFIEPQPIDAAYAEVVEMMMQVSDVAWLKQTIAMAKAAGTAKNS